MSERKVLNKYYPPDFDPSKIPRLRLPKERQYTVRLMAPCNMRCTTCGEYIYKGKKFNARKETVQNEEYLGIKIFRFYIKCPRCLAEITFKTDPENADYIVEHGATRNFQALKLAEEAAEKEAKEKEEEEKNNPMKLLENRTKASKREMESLEALEEIREMNQHHAKVDFKQLLWQNQLKLIKEQEQQEQEDEAFIKAVFYTADGEKIKRILDEPNTSMSDRKDKIHDGVLTGIVRKSSPVASESVSKKLKITEPVSDSRQRNIDMLKKAVKKKTVLPSPAKLVIEKESPIAGKSKMAEQKLISGSSEQKQTGLIMLSAYSDSDSDT